MISSDQQDFPDWFAGRLVRCIELAGDLAPRPGTVLEAEVERLGEELAREFAQSLVLPAGAESCAALFPRLWVVHAFVGNSLRFGLEPWKGVARGAFLEAQMVGCWEEHGKGIWESME